MVSGYSDISGYSDYFDYFAINASGEPYRNHVGNGFVMLAAPLRCLLRSDSVPTLQELKRYCSYPIGDMSANRSLVLKFGNPDC
jgi:hypothetical protein